MFVYSLKASKLKLTGLLVLCAFALVALFTVFPRGNSSANAMASAISEKSIKFDGIKTEENLLDFITSLGIEVKTPAYSSIDVDLPRVFDAVYSKYNDVQKQQGFDLSKYKGKTLHRYTYEITNYPATENASGKVYLTLFVYKNKVVGGDISSKDYGGFVRTFIDFGKGDGSQC